MSDFILNLAPTGMIPSKAMNERVPITPAEIVTDACACIELGASIIHLHARDENGVPTYKKDVYARIISGIRDKHPEAILCVSLSGRNFPELELRSEPLELRGDVKPDMASLTLSSLNFAANASVNAPEMVKTLATMMADRGIRPELEVFDLGMMNYANYLISKGMIAGPFYFNVLLGNIASAQAKPAQLAAFMADLPPGAVWSLGGVGADQLKCNTLGLLQADGVRVGLEDYLWMDESRMIPADNISLVERVVDLAKILGRRPADIRQVRRRLSL